jgi:hypothetical protein
VFGALFVVTALAQAAWAALVLTAPSAPLFAAGALGNVGVAGVWALSRTVGLPVGPGAGVPEPVAALDLAATSFEIVVVAASVLLLANGGPYAAVSGRAAKAFATIGAVAIAALTSAAYAGTPTGGHHRHDAADHHDVAATTHEPAPRAAPRRSTRPAAGSKSRAARATRPTAAGKKAVAAAHARPHAHTHPHGVPHRH